MTHFLAKSFTLSIHLYGQSIQKKVTFTTEKKGAKKVNTTLSVDNFALEILPALSVIIDWESLRL